MRIRVAVLIGLLMLTSVAIAQGGKGPVIGVLPFQDLSSDDNAQELRKVLGKKLQASLLNGSNATPKLLRVGGENPEETEVDLNYAIKLGKHYKTDFVVLGSLVSIDVEESDSGFSGPSFGGVNLSARGRKQSATVVLQLDFLDVAKGEKVFSQRFTAKDSSGKFSPNISTEYGSMDLDGSDFNNSTLGKATQKALDQMVVKINTATRDFKPAAAQATTGAAGGCSVLFRVVGPDMGAISSYTVAVGGNDLSAQVQNGVLKFAHSGGNPVIQVTVKQALDGVKTKPVYVGNVDSSCDKAEKVLALELDQSGEGKFTWWQ